jgi:hypothetical protein
MASLDALQDQLDAASAAEVSDLPRAGDMYRAIVASGESRVGARRDVAHGLRADSPVSPPFPRTLQVMTVRML